MAGVMDHIVYCVDVLIRTLESCLGLIISTDLAACNRFKWKRFSQSYDFEVSVALIVEFA